MRFYLWKKEKKRKEKKNGENSTDVEIFHPEQPTAAFHENSIKTNL